MVSWVVTRIVDTTRVHCPGALDGVLRLEFYNTLKGFFQSTDIWREQLPIYVVPGYQDYDLISGDGGHINRLLFLGIPRNQPVVNTSTPATPGGDFNNDFTDPLNMTYTPAAPAQQTPLPSNVEFNDFSSTAGELVSTGDHTILRIRNNPSIAQTWNAILSLTVTDPTDDDGMPAIPEWIVNKYQDYITDGLISRLMLHPAKPYSNKEMAAFHGKKYLIGVALARAEVRHGMNYSGQRWVFPQSFRSRSQRVFR